ncbi:MAG: pantetheine-phosphate adenylyltransferase [Candidatus Nanohaloarchaea archaeon]|nr:pantetheine-phosphate adenylyltransferase [Candidatus Nanohaloarchaea archaeon]
MEQVYEPSPAEREQLREPRGTVVQGDDLVRELRDRDYHRLIAVGDRVSFDLVDWEIPPDIAAVDGKVQRDPVDRGSDEIPAEIHSTAYNPAGGVTAEAWTAVREAVARTCTTCITIDGEEDLLALPAVLFAAPDSIVVYGQRDTGAVILSVADTAPFVEDLVDCRDYGRVVVGGSWDRLHAGHRSLLLAAFARGETVEIGVTTDAYLMDKVGDADFQPYTRRTEQLQRFLSRFGLEDRADLTPIQDVYGSAVDRGAAVVVTEETVAGAAEINAERERQGKEPIDVITVPLLAAADGDPVSTSRIRTGAIDRDGRPLDS